MAAYHRIDRIVPDEEVNQENNIYKERDKKLDTRKVTINEKVEEIPEKTSGEKNEIESSNRRNRFVSESSFYSETSKI